MLHPLAAFALLLVALPAPAWAQAQRVVLAGRNVVVWAPADSIPGRRPLVVFSHGFGGCAAQSKFLTEALAARGYWVVAPNHADARCGLGRPGRPGEPFRAPQRWSPSTYADRAADVRAVAKALVDSVSLRARLDPARIALAGHSLGGYTALGLAGGWQDERWRIAGVRAVLALSPYSDPYLAAGTLRLIRVPVMYQTGTLDFGINPSLKRSQGVFDNTPAPKYYVEFDGARHSAWTDRGDTYHAAIVRYALAFLDHYVLDRPADPSLTTAAPPVASLRFESDLGSHGAR